MYTVYIFCPIRYDTSGPRISITVSFRGGDMRYDEQCLKDTNNNNNNNNNSWLHKIMDRKLKYNRKCHYFEDEQDMVGS